MGKAGMHTRTGRTATGLICPGAVTSIVRKGSTKGRVQLAFLSDARCWEPVSCKGLPQRYPSRRKTSMYLRRHLDWLREERTGLVRQI